MKFLLDMPVSPILLSILEEFDHEGVHAHDIGKDKAADEELLKIALSENRTIITSDLDFPRLLALSFAHGPGIILFRGGNYSDKEMSELLRKVLKSVSTKVLTKSICVVNKKRIRIAKLPLS
jgi:predicted nuclease of predicted toxin-antitoxin system